MIPTKTTVTTKTETSVIICIPVYSILTWLLL